MRIALLTGLALMASASAQTTLQANAAANNGGAVNWGLYFDVSAAGSPITLTHLRTASNAAAGAAVEFEVYTYAAGSGLGGDAVTGPGSSMTGWNFEGLASGLQGPIASDISEEIDIPDFTIPAGQTIGVCLLFVTAGPRYFGTGTPAYETFTDGSLTLVTGDSRSAPFGAAGSFFSSRGLVGELTYGGGSIGTSYCGPAVANSTGASATMSASGSTAVADNDLTLIASDLPNNSFCFFITSQTQGFVAMPGGSLGNLCLGGAVGRYVGPGQIQNSGMTGGASLLIDLTAIPQPTGSVAAMAGDVYNFQLWYRDAVGGVAGSNFTDGLEITFQ